MFDDIFKLLAQAAAPQPQLYPGFLGELRQEWSHNAALATLRARWRWQELPAGLEQQAALLEQQAQASGQRFREQQEMNDALNAQFGALGMSPSYGGMSMGMAGPSPDEVLFLRTMGLARAQRGEAGAAPPAMARDAERVLSGQLDPMAFLASTLPPAQRAAFGQLTGFSQLIGGVQNIWQLSGVVTAAMLVPRSRIPQYLGIGP